MSGRPKLCRDFQNGRCRYGANCKFSHTSQQQPQRHGPLEGRLGGPAVQQGNPFGALAGGGGGQGVAWGSGAHTRNPPQQQQFLQPQRGQRQQAPPSHVEQRLQRPQGGGAVPGPGSHAPPAAEHDCHDTARCKEMVRADLETEMPLWKLTCYSHARGKPCQVTGDISYEELRWRAYQQLRQGAPIQNVVAEERALVARAQEMFRMLASLPPHQILQGLGAQFNITPIGASPSPIVFGAASFGGGMMQQQGAPHTWLAGMPVGSAAPPGAPPFGAASSGPAVGGGVFKSPFGGGASILGTAAAAHPGPAPPSAFVPSFAGVGVAAPFGSAGGAQPFSLPQSTMLASQPPSSGAPTMAHVPAGGSASTSGPGPMSDEDAWRAPVFYIGKIPESEPPIQYC